MAEKLGARVSATLWHVHYRYIQIEEERRIIRPGEKRIEKGELVGGEMSVLSADPTGDDLRAVVAFEVLGPNLKPEHQFTIMAMQRCCDVRGFAQIAGAGKKD